MCRHIFIHFTQASKLRTIIIHHAIHFWNDRGYIQAILILFASMNEENVVSSTGHLAHFAPSGCVKATQKRVRTLILFTFNYLCFYLGAKCWLIYSLRARNKSRSFSPVNTGTMHRHEHHTELLHCVSNHPQCYLFSVVHGPSHFLSLIVSITISKNVCPCVSVTVRPSNVYYNNAPTPRNRKLCCTRCLVLNFHVAENVKIAWVS